MNFRIFIGGLCPKTPESAIQSYFSRFGEVGNIELIRDRNTGQSKGYGFFSCSAQKTFDTILAQEHVLERRKLNLNNAFQVIKTNKFGAADKRKIYIPQIPGEISEDDLLNYFKKDCKVIQAYKVKIENSDTNAFAVVEFKYPKDCRRAMKKNDHIIGDSFKFKCHPFVDRNKDKILVKFRTYKKSLTPDTTANKTEIVKPVEEKSLEKSLPPYTYNVKAVSATIWRPARRDPFLSQEVSVKEQEENQGYPNLLYRFNRQVKLSQLLFYRNVSFFQFMNL